MLEVEAHKITKVISIPVEVELLVDSKVALLKDEVALLLVVTEV